MCLFVCFCWGLFGLLTEDIRLFAFHLFSYKLRIVDRLQNVDDRQSLERARHGLKKIDTDKIKRLEERGRSTEKANKEETIRHTETERTE